MNEQTGGRGEYGAGILDVVGEYVGLTKKNREWFGVCPFHADKNPSLAVNPDKGGFYCFGCGVGGGAAQFVAKIEDIGIREAHAKVRDILGLAPIAGDAGRMTRPRDQKAEDIRAVAQIAQASHRMGLMRGSGEPAREYLRKRRLAGADGRCRHEPFAGEGCGMNAIRHFRLGYAPMDGDGPFGDNQRPALGAFAVAVGDNKTASEIHDAGAGELSEAGQKMEARFEAAKNSLGLNSEGTMRGRLIIPLEDETGKTAGFIGRAIAPDAEPKYLITQNMEIFSKGKTLFNERWAREALKRENALHVVEGAFDAVALAAMGIGAAVATLGTAMTDEQAKKIAEIAGGKPIVLAYDADEAGRRANIANARKLAEFGAIPQIFVLPTIPMRSGQEPRPAKDADELRRGFMATENWPAIIKKHTVPYPRFFALAEKAEANKSGGEIGPRAEACAREITAMANPADYGEWAKQMALGLGIDEKAMRANLDAEAGADAWAERKRRKLIREAEMGGTFAISGAIIADAEIEAGRSRERTTITVADAATGRNTDLSTYDERLGKMFAQAAAERASVTVTGEIGQRA